MAHSKSGKLEGRSILITGASSGIGRATARLLVEEGAKVGLLDLAGDPLVAIATELDMPLAACDLGDRDATFQAVEQLGGKLGRIDGLVNCAGVGLAARLEDISEEDWDRMLEINLTAVFRLCKAALPWLLKEEAATIVNIASAQGILPNLPGASAYAASKAGLIGFTKALAAELGPRIRSNVLCPGLTRTPMAPTVAVSNVVQGYALKRIAEPEEMAAAILFLTGPDSSFVSGITLAADGGRTYH